MFPASQTKGSCKPCRERQVECDERKPRCSECISSNKICRGYDLGNIFINMNSNSPPPVWTRSQNAQKYLVVDLASTIPHQQQRTGPHALSTPQASQLGDMTDIHQVVDLFLDMYYGRFGPDRASSNHLQPGSECGGWRALLPRWIGQSLILDIAIRAMATCFVGTQYQDEAIIDQGRNAYLDVLRMIQRVLSEPNSAQRKDLLATTLVMSSTELFLSNGGGASQLTHIEGANRLLHCTVESCDVQDFEDLHIYVLNQGLFECISSRRSFPFSYCSYRPMVRRLYAANPGYRDNLYFQWCELIVPLPNLLEAVDGVSRAATSSTAELPSAVLNILDDLRILEQTLVPWHEAFKRNMPGPWTFPAAQISAESVPFPLQFVSIEACAMYCLHWTSQLLILDARNTLISHLPRSQVSQLPTTPDLFPQMTEYASLICRSVQFCAQNTSFAATENMFLPLYVVTSYYERQGDENRKNWCIGAFATIAEEHKIGYGVEKLDLSERIMSARASSLGPH